MKVFLIILSFHINFLAHARKAKFKNRTHRSLPVSERSCFFFRFRLQIKNVAVTNASVIIAPKAIIVNGKEVPENTIVKGPRKLMSNTILWYLLQNTQVNKREGAVLIAIYAVFVAISFSSGWVFFVLAIFLLGG